MRRALLFLLPLALLTACRVEPEGGAEIGSAADTVRTASPAAVPDSAVPAPGGAGTCRLTVATPGDTLTLYRRPSTEADVFGVLTPVDTLQVTGRTADGWLGFDPAAMQAANVGLFRLRWVAPDGPYRTTGDCGAVPVVDKLPPSACFTMAGSPVAVYARPDTTAPVLDSLRREGYAEVTTVNPANWARVRLRAGQFGWVAPDDVNFNGRCDALGG